MRAAMIKLFFPGSLTEYEKAKQIHLRELRVYRRRWHFILGLILLAVPLLLAVTKDPDWKTYLGVIMVIAGFILIHDTITEHYCLKLIRDEEERKKAAEPGATDNPDDAQRL
jgi:uncharacterized membrane protein